MIVKQSKMRNINSYRALGNKMFYLLHDQTVLIRIFKAPCMLLNRNYGICVSDGSLNHMQLITSPEVIMEIWRLQDMALQLVWPDRGRRSRLGQTTESDRSRGFHFSMLAEWEVTNWFVIPTIWRIRYTGELVSFTNSEKQIVSHSVIMKLCWLHDIIAEMTRKH